MKKSKLEKAYEKHEQKITELVDGYKLYQRISHEMYVRGIVINRLLRQYMTSQDIEKAINEYRSEFNSKHTFNESDSSGSFLDGVGDETRYQREESGE